MTANELAKELREIAVTPSFAIRLAAADIVEAHAKLTHELMCELQDPNGTIWEHAKRLQDERDALKAKVEELELAVERANERASQWADLAGERGVEKDTLAAENATMRELLTEIRDNEVNAQCEADKFLRNHEPSRLSVVEAENAELKEDLGKCHDALGESRDSDTSELWKAFDGHKRLIAENAELRNHEYAGELKAARDEVQRLSGIVANLREICTTDHESKEAFVGRVVSALGDEK